MSKILNKETSYQALIDRIQYYIITNPHPYPDDPYDSGRHTYCHLAHYAKGAWHFFEIRGMSVKENRAHVSAVNWTLCAGTCAIDLTEVSVKDWKILEDEPTLQVLYGNR